MRPLKAFIVFAFVSSLWFGVSHATMLERWDTNRLTKESKSIQIGEVLTKWSSWDPEKKMVYTYIRMRVDSTIKGKKQEEVLFRQPGGQSNGIGMVVHGVANFRQGERVLVFLGVSEDGAPTPVGLAQGKFRLYKSQLTGEDMALFRAPKNVEFLVRGEQGQQTHVVESHDEQRIPLKVLVQEIQSAMGGEANVAY